jgi:molybdenum cofactor cytidylyltransferase
MGGANKLLEPVGGVPMIRRTVEAVLSSETRPVLVVTGHQADAVRASLAGLAVAFVHNPDFASGLAGSLKAGIAALPPEADGAVVCLGDMPFVRPADIDKLIAAFNPAEGRLICVPVHAGRRGNPVLWSRRFFAEMLGLSGDAGAKPLLEAHSDTVVEVAVASDGIFQDLDTPEALAAV